MTTKKRCTMVMLVLLLLGIAWSVSAQPGPEFAAGVTWGDANASPAAGYSTGETNSRVDDYIYQDEQINLDKEAGVVKVLRTNQKILINDYVDAIVPCKKVNPRELRGPIRTLCRKEGGDADVLQDKEKNEFYLQVTCPRFQLPYVEQAIKDLDEAWVKERENGSGELYYHAKFRSAAAVQNVTQFYRSPMGFFVPDPANNAYYFGEAPCALGLQRYAVKQVDIPPSQVLVEATIYEVNSVNDLKLGVDWVAWKNGPGRNLFEGIASATHEHEKVYPTPITYQIAGANMEELVRTDWHEHWRYGSFNALVVSSYLDFLQSKGKAKVVAKNTLLAKSGTAAEINAVDQVISFVATPSPQPAMQSHRLTNNEGEVVTVNLPDEDRVESFPRNYEYPYGRELTYERTGSVGVRVRLTPYVGLESTEMAIIVDISSLSGYTPQGTPMINVRHAESYVRLANGEPYVLGGLKRTENVKRSGKVPFLGSLPILGWVFGGETEANRDTEIVIVLKPKMMLSSDSVLEMPQEAKTIVAQVKGEQALPIPNNPFGYDQWLLDKEK
jgi:hypothetical protein